MHVQQSNEDGDNTTVDLLVQGYAEPTGDIVTCDAPGPAMQDKIFWFIKKLID